MMFNRQSFEVDVIDIMIQIVHKGTDSFKSVICKHIIERLLCYVNAQSTLSCFRAKCIADCSRVQSLSKSLLYWRKKVIKVDFKLSKAISI